MQMERKLRVPTGSWLNNFIPVRMGVDWIGVDWMILLRSLYLFFRLILFSFFNFLISYMQFCTFHRILLIE